MRVKESTAERLRALVEAIAEHGAEHGYPPTIRDLQKRTGASSTSVVAYRLAVCERAGLIRRVPGRARAITLTAEGRALAGSSSEPASRSSAGERAA